MSEAVQMADAKQVAHVPHKKAKKKQPKLTMKERLDRTAKARWKRESKAGIVVEPPARKEEPVPVPQRANKRPLEKSAIHAFLEALPDREFDDEPGICNRLLQRFLREVPGLTAEATIETVFGVMPNVASWTRAVLAEKARRKAP